MLHAGDKGVVYNVPSNITLQAATALNLILLPQGGTRIVVSMTVGTTPLINEEGNKVADPYFWAHFTTTGTEFATAGNYTVEMQMVQGTTLDIVCDPYIEKVLVRL